MKKNDKILNNARDENMIRPCSFDETERVVDLVSAIDATNVDLTRNEDPNEGQNSKIQAYHVTFLISLNCSPTKRIVNIERRYDIKRDESIVL